VVALVGANGAGKTTLRAIGGLLRFHRGSVEAGVLRLDGIALSGTRPGVASSLGIGQALEGRRVFKDLSVRENLAVGAFAAHGPSEAPEVLEPFPRLAERMTQAAGTLSGGEQQMLAIGRALMARPRLLLLDEPSLGLAPLIVAEIGDAIRAIAAQGTAVLLVDQNTALATRAADHAYLLENGRTVAYGPAAELPGDAHVRAAYLGTSPDAEAGVAL
jgi:ABC-type branched-subunit amino acid transport system ATPase component